MPDALTYFAVLTLVALTASRRQPVARMALRWLAGEAVRDGRDGSRLNTCTRTAAKYPRS